LDFAGLGAASWREAFGIARLQIQRGLEMNAHSDGLFVRAPNVVVNRRNCATGWADGQQRLAQQFIPHPFIDALGGKSFCIGLLARCSVPCDSTDRPMPIALLVAAMVADHLRLSRSIISRSSSRAKPTPGPGTRECIIEPGQDAEATINATDAETGCSTLTTALGRP
jgi:hypothetical protein